MADGESNLALWLRAGSNAAAVVALASEFIEEPDDSAYLTEIQVLFADMSPSDLALSAAWLGNFASRALVDCFDGDVDQARDELRRVALHIAESRVSES